jgi:hypothetical protein
MITPTATDLLRTIDATLINKVEPSLSDVGGRSALATVRHLLNFVRVRIEREGQALTDDIAALRPLLSDALAYFEGLGETDQVQAIGRALAETETVDASRYLTLDDLAARAGKLREALHHALERLQALRGQHAGEPRYTALRAAIRAYIVRQIEDEGDMVGPAFFGRGPRR